ncbi:MAG: prepilin-type N-terminal cleavage/methylation domain-containing protein [Planctomycetes bacterium]|nr:prepilin-type N-terminal cleavage/methylation domain-containing protein [Planctomycetota bacterium]
MDMNHRKGFTLIELLVVVSAIALLFFILIPVISANHQQSHSAVCLGNQRGLVMAWLMYAADNDDKLVNGNAHPRVFLNSKTSSDVETPWVGPPLDEDGNYKSGDVTFEERLRGIREGALAPYTGQATELYHCPADERVTKGTRHGDRPMYLFYRSYSVSQALSTHDGSDGQLAIKTLSTVQNPSRSMVFVEEAYDGGPGGNVNFNDAYWNFTGPTCYCWWDPLAIFHPGATTFSFADGHAVLHKWVEERTIQYHKDRYGPLNTIFRRVRIDSGQVGDSPDMDWTIRNVGAIYE